MLGREIGDCNPMPLAEGDSFVLTAGPRRTDDFSCPVNGARSEVPSFATSIFTSCEGTSQQLALNCRGMNGDSCEVSAQLRLGPLIAPGQDSIEPAGFLVTLGRNGCELRGCFDKYRVRIDRLPRTPPG